MLNYVHEIPTKLYFGKGQISHLDEILRSLGKKVLLTYGGGSIKKMGLYDTVIDILKKGGFEVTELSGIEPNPRIESVEEGVRLCKENNIDVILAVGGGSTIDCSKAIAAGVFYDGDLWDMVASYHGTLKALPLVDILTLSATGSEYDGGGVITNLKTHEKIGNSYTYPYASICDPTYTFSVSKYQTASGTADIMSHIFEGYFSRTEDSDLSDHIAEGVLKTAIKYLPVALKEPDNYTARANLMAISSVACSGIPQYGKQDTGWPCHAMEHELSAFYDITHGIGLAILTPRWMRFILEKDPSCTWRFVRFAKNVWGLDGDDEKALAIAGIEKLEEFFAQSGIPKNLTELKITDEHFEEMAAHANYGNYLKDAFVALTNEDIVEIYKACL
ncbi:iron-containing alcohol dehydrogenase [Butyrivibrio sp. AE2005]|uniref:iron-containing alcohol dehydrogenase n=1 Tax=Butyrivibrio sp. AE2005 TaxID=1496722 RepID=UPI00047C6781|nr:iron-containing alcohol dehydrogenase [Butyrivibrio sp. AE2005]